jgi:hypothetical protein
MPFAFVCKNTYMRCGGRGSLVMYESFYPYMLGLFSFTDSKHYKANPHYHYEPQSPKRTNDL